MISKELFSAVTGIQLENGFAYDGYSDFHHISKWNIHELAHKCKEWAANKGYYISSFSDYTEDWFCNIRFPGKVPFRQTFIHLNEPEAIFAACEYILKEQKKELP